MLILLQLISSPILLLMWLRLVHSSLNRHKSLPKRYLLQHFSSRHFYYVLSQHQLTIAVMAPAPVIEKIGDGETEPLKSKRLVRPSGLITQDTQMLSVRVL